MTTPLIKIKKVTVEIVYMDDSSETIALKDDARLGPVKGEANLSQEVGRIDVTQFGDLDAVPPPTERYKLAAEFSAATATYQRVDADGSIWTGPLDEPERRRVAELIREMRDESA